MATWGGQWIYSGGDKATIGITGRTDAITLRYRVRSWASDEWESVEQLVPIVWMSCNLGGKRPWFRCDCRSDGRYWGRWVAKLYGAGRVFACRHCYGLVYATQWSDALDGDRPG